ncbi:MAG: nucleotide exchange factor GrpE [Lachnospiraceae bacterium]|nr:nucleotide exchange factor GrpE [Lachnospiraceae bacterium]
MQDTATKADTALNEMDTEAPIEAKAPSESKEPLESLNEPAASDVPEKKGLRKKAKTDKQKERIAELEDRVIRQMAEFENFRKRTEKEKSLMFETGARSIIEKMLPVVDNFERGLKAIPEAEKDSSFAEGMNMIYKQLMAEFDNLDVKAIPAVGQEFNPDLHNAVMQVESSEYETGIIAAEMQRGYTYRNTVVRYSMVSVVE